LGCWGFAVGGGWGWFLIWDGGGERDGDDVCVARLRRDINPNRCQRSHVPRIHDACLRGDGIWDWRMEVWGWRRFVDWGGGVIGGCRVSCRGRGVVRAGLLGLVVVLETISSG
jgi:hypothetical protein